MERSLSSYSPGATGEAEGREAWGHVYGLGDRGLGAPKAGKGQRGQTQVQRGFSPGCSVVPLRWHSAGSPSRTPFFAYKSKRDGPRLFRLFTAFAQAYFWQGSQ